MSLIITNPSPGLEVFPFFAAQGTSTRDTRRLVCLAIESSTGKVIPGVRIDGMPDGHWAFVFAEANALDPNRSYQLVVFNFVGDFNEFAYQTQDFGVKPFPDEHRKFEHTRGFVILNPATGSTEPDRIILADGTKDGSTMMTSGNMKCSQFNLQSHPAFAATAIQNMGQYWCMTVSIPLNEPLSTHNTFEFQAFAGGSHKETNNITVNG